LLEDELLEYENAMYEMDYEPSVFSFEDEFLDPLEYAQMNHTPYPPGMNQEPYPGCYDYEE
jgi:hypothetical protein